jgi:Tol biopolymer transport system component
MKWSKTSEIKLMVCGFVAGLLLLGGRVMAGFMFGTPVNLGSAVNSMDSDGSPDVSADGLTLYFDSFRADGPGSWDIWVTTRPTTNSEWGPAKPLPAPVNGIFSDSGPSISADSLSLYFASDRFGGYGGPDLYVATRQSIDEPWGPAVNLGPIVNSGSYDNHPSISADGLTLYFESARDGNYDLYMTQRATTDSEWIAPVSLGPATNTSYIEMSPDISSDGLSLFFDRRGATGDRDIWVLARNPRSDGPMVAVNLGPPVNTGYEDTDPSISADSRTLYFASTRPGGVGGQDIWRVSIAPVRAMPDFNGDGVVNLKDFRMLAQYWLTDEQSVDISPPPYGDGVVDYKDLAGLTEYWLAQPGLVAHWALDEAEGNFAHDSAGGHDGTLRGGPLWQPGGGRINGALLLDGVDDYIGAGFVLDPGIGPFSVFVWVKGGAPRQVIMSQADGTGTGRSWLCMDAPDGRLMTELKGIGRQGASLVSPTVITDGVWREVGLVWDGTYRHLYVDGREVVKDGGPSDALERSDGGLYIGASKTRDAGTFFSGLIDEVRIYNVALTP